LGRSKLSPLRSSVLFEVKSFEVGSFEVESFEVGSLEVGSFKVQSFEVQSVNPKLYAFSYILANKHKSSPALDGLGAPQSANFVSEG
jgi:hypothetical protein